VSVDSHACPRPPLHESCTDRPMSGSYFSPRRATLPPSPRRSGSLSSTTARRTSSPDSSASRSSEGCRHIDHAEGAQEPEPERDELDGQHVVTLLACLAHVAAAGELGEQAVGWALSGKSNEAEITEIDWPSGMRPKRKLEDIEAAFRGDCSWGKL